MQACSTEWPGLLPDAVGQHPKYIVVRFKHEVSFPNRSYTNICCYTEIITFQNVSSVFLSEIKKGGRNHHIFNSMKQTEVLNSSLAPRVLCGDK